MPPVPSLVYPVHFLVFPSSVLRKPLVRIISARLTTDTCMMSLGRLLTSQLRVIMSMLGVIRKSRKDRQMSMTLF